MVEHEVKDQLEWIDKDNVDKKLLNIQAMDKDGLDGGVIGGDDQKFRVTMAMNIFDNERAGEEQPGRSKVVKKKKKKFGALKKDYESLDNKNSDEYNPFGIDDPTILGLNSIDNLSGERKEDDKDENNKGKKSGLDRKRRKK